MKTAPVTRLPGFPSSVILDKPEIQIGSPADVSAADYFAIYRRLMQLRPWRKGPFSIFGHRIQSEWNSSLKWDRLVPFLGDIRGQVILDVGANNGYTAFRLLPLGPKQIVVIEPYHRYFEQCVTLSNWIGYSEILPVHGQLSAAPTPPADGVLLLGVWYHLSDPENLISSIFNRTKPGGWIIVESIVADTVITPQKRYANMRNVYQIPTADHIVSVLSAAGYQDFSQSSPVITTSAEQRATLWGTGQSLDHFLDPYCPENTIEGYPRPKRQIIRAFRRN